MRGLGTAGDRSRTKEKKVIEYERIPLTCPCGKPLELVALKDGGCVLKWAVGHIDSLCSPMIHGVKLGDVMANLGRTLETKRKFPSAEEYFAQKRVNEESKRLNEQIERAK